MNIANLLTRTACTFPDLPALAHGMEFTHTYGEFADQSAALAGALLTELGLEKGDRVALIMKNHPDYWVALFAIWQAGLVAVPINAKLHLNEFKYIIEHSGARLCFATTELASELKNLSDILKTINISEPGYSDLKTHTPITITDVSPDDLAWLFYTSGTTGKPKGAMLSHRNLLCCTMSYFADVTQINPGDAVIHSAPQTHGSGIYGLPLVAKGGIQVTPKSGGFDPVETLELIANYPNSCFFFAPTMIHRLINSEAFKGADTRNIKLIVYGGGPMYEADIRKALDAIGPKFCQIYGQGEAPMTITALTQWELTHNANHPRRSERLASVGTARTDIEIRIIDKAGNPLPVGEVGEIILRGDVVMLGYWQNKEATRDTIRDGWLYTGDLGCFDKDGFLTLKDRSKDVIISGGTNIYPREIEEILLTHPTVDEISIIGRYHPEWGEEVVAFIVLASGAKSDTNALDAHCLEHLARFKRPKAYFFIESLPKNNNGKVLKTELRELVK